MREHTRTGLDIIFETHGALLRRARIGLLCHPASVDSRLRHAVELFTEHHEFRLTALFGPQHGILGNTQDNMIEWNTFTYPGAGIPAYSLYSDTRKPTPEMLQDIDILVCDMQDVGTRVYTFIWTMYLAMQACAEQRKPFLVLDRPNPIGGRHVEGNVLEPDFRSFVGMHTIPMRHGMTVAELAKMFNEEAAIGCELHIAPMRGWSRDMHFDDTGLPWVLPSPNMPTPDTARVYPGTVIFEGVNISEARGTTRPFELIGAPWLQAWPLAEAMNKHDFPGVHFRPAHFQPTFHKAAGQICGGIQIHVTDRHAFKPFISAVTLLAEIIRLAPEQFQWKQPPYEYEKEKLPIDIIFGTEKVRRQIEQGASPEEMESSWQQELREYITRREKFLIYD